MEGVCVSLGVGRRVCVNFNLHIHGTGGGVISPLHFGFLPHNFDSHNLSAKSCILGYTVELFIDSYFL